jgi:hypothetical protein
MFDPPPFSAEALIATFLFVDIPAAESHTAVKANPFVPKALYLKKCGESIKASLLTDDISAPVFHGVLPIDIPLFETYTPDDACAVGIVPAEVAIPVSLNDVFPSTATLKKSV